MSDLATANNKGKTKRPSLRKRLTKFSLRAIFLLTTLSAIGVVVYQRRMTINSVAKHLESLGAKIEYHADPIPGMSKVFGDFFKDARVINLKRTQVKNDDLARIGNLRLLERLYLPGTSVSAKGIGHLATNERLQCLSLWGCKYLSDDAFTELKRIKNLQVLDIHNTSMKGDSLHRIAELPALRHVITSASFRQMTSKHIQILGDLTERGLRVSPVGTVHIGEIDDEDLKTLVSMDTARMSSISITDSRITSIGMECIADLDPFVANFVDCDLDADALDCLAESNWGRGYYGFCQVGFTPTELAQRIGRHCNNLEISPKCFRFKLDNRAITFWAPDSAIAKSAKAPPSSKGVSETQPSHPSLDKQISPELIRALTKLKRLKLDRELCPPGVAAVHKAQPNVHLEIYGPKGLDESFWRMMEETPSLTGLTIYGPPAGEPRFTADHQIEWFTYMKYAGGRSIQADQSFFNEVAKLSKLRFLAVQHDNSIGKQIAPLVQLKNLKTLRFIGNVDANAILHVVKMNLKHFDISHTKRISKTSLNRLRDAPFTVRWGGNNLIKRK